MGLVKLDMLYPNVEDFVESHERCESQEANYRLALFSLHLCAPDEFCTLRR